MSVMKVESFVYLYILLFRFFVFMFCVNIIKKTFVFYFLCCIVHSTYFSRFIHNICSVVWYIVSDTHQRLVESFKFLLCKLPDMSSIISFIMSFIISWHVLSWHILFLLFVYILLPWTDLAWKFSQISIKMYKLSLVWLLKVGCSSTVVPHYSDCCQMTRSLEKSE